MNYLHHLVRAFFSLKLEPLSGTITKVQLQQRASTFELVHEWMSSSSGLHGVPGAIRTITYDLKEAVELFGNPLITMTGAVVVRLHKDGRNILGIRIPFVGDVADAHPLSTERVTRFHGCVDDILMTTEDITYAEKLQDMVREVQEVRLAAGNVARTFGGGVASSSTDLVPQQQLPDK